MIMKPTTTTTRFNQTSIVYRYTYFWCIDHQLHLFYHTFLLIFERFTSHKTFHNQNLKQFPQFSHVFEHFFLHISDTHETLTN